MNIGKMNDRVTLQPPTKTADGMGGSATVWTTGNVTVWAEIKKPRLQTIEAAGTVISDMTREIAVRYRTDVKKGWRVVSGTKTYAVEHVYDQDGKVTVMVCREMVK